MSDRHSLQIQFFESKMENYFSLQRLFTLQLKTNTTYTLVVATVQMVSEIFLDSYFKGILNLSCINQFEWTNINIRIFQNFGGISFIILAAVAFTLDKRIVNGF